MKMQIQEFARFTGVSVRTLHYYDEIGLLKPACVDRRSGYRYYDEQSLLRMQEILFYRELDFSLKSIEEILSSPHYDKNKALQEQKQMLTLKKERLERLISAVDSAMKGENVMCAFDNSKLEAYKAEAKEKWGNTEAYKEYEQRGAKQPDADGLMAVFAEMGKIRHLDPGSKEAQEMVAELQGFISENFYNCTKQILAGLGQMYVADERFRENIDRAGGAGTAEFACKAIEIFCK